MQFALTFAIASLAIVLSFTTAKGYGAINLSWDDCGSHGGELRRFACDTNAGSHTLVASFMPPAGLDSMNGHAAVLDLQSDSASLPDWWSMATGLCRAGSLSGDFDFTSGPFNCLDYWQGVVLSGTVMDAPSLNRARIRCVAALPAGDARIRPVAEGTEVYSVKIIIGNARTEGEGACAGCTTPLCIVFTGLLITQPPPNANYFLSAPGTRSWVGWQCGGMGGAHGPLCKFWDCSTPTHARTWGQLKQLYR